MKVVVVPSTLALLPEYAGATDPVPELRSASASAVSWLLEDAPRRARVIAAPPRADNVARGVAEAAGVRVGRALLAAADATVTTDSHETVLVVANGSATRGDKAPGHLDERAIQFDDALSTAWAAGDPGTLRDLDPALGEELWCHDVPALQQLGRLVTGPVRAAVDYADAPYGVQYWVVRWTCGS